MRKEQNRGMKEEERKKNEMASMLVTVKSEQKPDLLLFSDFNQKQRRPAVEKA